MKLSFLIKLAKNKVFSFFIDSYAFASLSPMRLVSDHSLLCGLLGALEHLLQMRPEVPDRPLGMAHEADAPVKLAELLVLIEHMETFSLRLAACLVRDWRCLELHGW